VSASQFQLSVYVERTVRPSVEALLPATTTMAAFETALRAAVLDKPDLLPTIEKNPPAALVAIIKCARLGLSLNPIDKHFALVPKGGKVEGWVQYQGWQHLVMASGAVEWMQADVVYKQEVDRTKPFFDRETQQPNHVPNTFERDSYVDNDIVGAYCCLKLKGQTRLKSRILTRGDINKRRAKGAPNSTAWRDDFATMCIGKAIKALCQQPDVPKTRELADALMRGLMDDEGEDGGGATAVLATLPTEPTPIPKALAAPQTSDEYLFAQRDKEPFPDDETHRAELRKAIELEAAMRNLTADTFDDKPIADMDAEQLQAILDAVRKQQ
jgi:recombinational DNA repair protein RecT